jgi:hypothetical protein
MLFMYRKVHVDLADMEFLSVVTQLMSSLLSVKSADGESPCAKDEISQREVNLLNSTISDEFKRKGIFTNNFKTLKWVEDQPETA